MKKRNQKLSLHRETVARLEISPLRRVVGGAGGLAADREVLGEVTSCGEECGCPDDSAY